MLLPPIGIFAVLAYSKAGNIHWPYAMLLAVGFAVELPIWSAQAGQ